MDVPSHLLYEYHDLVPPILNARILDKIRIIELGK